MWVVDSIKSGVNYGWNTLNQAMSKVVEVGWYTVQTAAALPSFVVDTLGKPQARSLVTNTGYILARDVAPMVATIAANQVLQAYLVGDEDVEALSWSAYALASMASWATQAITVRQTIRTASHTAVMMTQHPRVFKETATSRAIVNDMCKDCNTKRVIKGEIRSLLMYFAQRAALALIGKIPYVGPIFEFPLATLPYLGTEVSIAAVGETLLNGQLFMEYRLANDGICDRHRQEYYREYLEFCLSLGISHRLAVDGLCVLTEHLTGVPQSLYKGTFQNLATLYFTGLTHHMEIPKPIAQSKRWGDPLDILVRQRLANGMDATIILLRPGLPAFIKYMFPKTDNEIDFKKAAKNTYQFFSGPTYQRYARVFIPGYLVSLEEFVTDRVNKAYWPSLRKDAIYTIDVYRDYRDGKLVWVATSLPKGMVKWLGKKFAGVAPGVTGTALSIVKSEDINYVLDSIADALPTFGDEAATGKRQRPRLIDMKAAEPLVNVDRQISGQEIKLVEEVKRSHDGKYLELRGEGVIGVSELDPISSEGLPSDHDHGVHADKKKPFVSTMSLVTTHAPLVKDRRLEAPREVKEGKGLELNARKPASLQPTSSLLTMGVLSGGGASLVRTDRRISSPPKEDPTHVQQQHH